MQFVKYHAAGNDYLVYQAAAPFRFSEHDISIICDRHRGLGSDGILVPLLDAGEMLSLCIYNTDGSQAEKSGNGLRIFCRYLWDQGIVADTPFQLSTKGGVVNCQVLAQGKSISIAMGQARFPDNVESTIVIDDTEFQLNPVSMGNPHCVIFVTQPTETLARNLGPIIEHLSIFPNRTNVQFVRVIDRQNIEMHIWERGVGYTLSSGTSSCAAAAVSRRLGLVDAKIAVRMPGGVITIELDDDYEVLMQGPVCKVGSYSLDTECLV
ncbi:diaminopimelate epimerase [Pseudomonas sp. KFB-139]|uniref:Diaminopimelate epimerase n=1 Tax=Pseudomonas serbiensis TaxID=3064350 RepID=A0ABT9CSN4_9PSED|nr:diaminopimelate epimerase [Pseudomonas sp. KFB-138]MDO7926840.1 diaminopimelate epimerase [Pseudomonas sp. KFB-138]